MCAFLSQGRGRSERRPGSRNRRNCVVASQLCHLKFDVHSLPLGTIFDVMPALVQQRLLQTFKTPKSRTSRFFRDDSEWTASGSKVFKDCSSLVKSDSCSSSSSLDGRFRNGHTSAIHLPEIDFVVASTQVPTFTKAKGRCIVLTAKEKDKTGVAAPAPLRVTSVNSSNAPGQSQVAAGLPKAEQDQGTAPKNGE